eukprot:UN29389
MAKFKKVNSGSPKTPRSFTPLQVEVKALMKEWQNHCDYIEKCVKSSYEKTPKWDDRMWDGLTLPSITVMLPLLRTLKINRFSCINIKPEGTEVLFLILLWVLYLMI